MKDEFLIAIVPVAFFIIIILFSFRETDKGEKKQMVLNKDLKSGVKKISLTNLLLIVLNVLLLITIYQLSEIKDRIPGECQAWEYLSDTTKKLDKVNENLNSIDYTLYRKL